MVIMFVQLSSLILLMSHFGICMGSSSEILCIPSEREALLKFKLHLTDPSNRLSSWSASNPNCCHWVGVVCNNVTSHILELHLNNPSNLDYYQSMLGGEINPSLVELKHLKYLDLNGNDFGGMQIPSFLCQITTLTYLNLSYAGFYGKIPDQIWNLSDLLYLDLTYAGSGAIPYQIGNLTNLLHLGLQSHPFKEPLVAENLDWLSGISSLQYLDLSFANLSKSHDWVQTMQSLPFLVELHLLGCSLNDYNQPSMVNFTSLSSLSLSLVPKWISKLNKLVSLQVWRNAYDEALIPFPYGIQNLTLLENLDLSGYPIASPIPFWLYHLHRLKFLNLSFNNLRVNISENIANLTSLVRLDLSSNQLEGVIPKSLRNLCNLREISFTNLKLNQKVSKILEILTPCISHGLRYLDISSSGLSGHLTDQIGIFENLVDLDISDNSIGGSLPRSLGNLSSLRTLYIDNNKFKGNPFVTLGSLCKLLILSISNNLFEGFIRENNLVSLSSLKTFKASGNNLTLNVAPHWHPSFHLIHLKMRDWNLGPSFPLWIRSQKNLHYLDMSNTRISDSIPTWVWGMFSSKNSILIISDNHIHGELRIPSTSWNKFFTNALHLDLSRNSLSGSMTDFLCQNKHDKPSSLETLNLASNKLSGEIPDCWMMWPYLGFVNLESNNFVGNLPPSMASLSFLRTLHIRNNKLSGRFPLILKNASQLIFLDLGENKFTGIIPTWVGKSLLNLKILCLRSNNFIGQIPNQICKMSLLQVMDLAQNNFSGNIPYCFNHFNAMMLKNKRSVSFIYIFDANNTEPSIVSAFLWLKGRIDEYKSILGLVTSVDISHNNLSGEIPKEITNLDGLIYLNLSKNHLIGPIPHSIGNMRSLESIDLSMNQLSGEIPHTISNLTFLNGLNLSYNHLEGKIPFTPQMQTFEASDFVGNNLCGPPLLINCSSTEEISEDGDKEEDAGNGGVNWYFVIMALGFNMGFLGLVAPLFISRSWRHKYFLFLDAMWAKLQGCWSQ